MTDKPWTTAGLTGAERVKSLRVYGITTDKIEEAIHAAVRDALTDAGPKWRYAAEEEPKTTDECYIIDQYEDAPFKGFFEANNSVWWDFDGNSHDAIYWIYVRDTIPPMPTED
jgi:hypothetical protein